MGWSFKAIDALPEQQFRQWSKLLEERTGIKLTPQQKVLLQTQMSIRMRELDIARYDDYFSYVNKGTEGIAEWQILVDRLVVKETMFFRHAPSINYVKQLLEKRITKQMLSHSFEVWSLGCSTGEEPYSLAMVVNDCFEMASLKPYFGIMASDVSLPALAAARKGIYTERRMAFVSEEHRQHYFQSIDKYHFRVCDKLKQRVCFVQANILGLNKLPTHKMDVIFCQNVLVYFRKWRRREILNHLVSCLKPGGVLIVGLGEITNWQHSDVKRVANEEIQAYVKALN